MYVRNLFFSISEDNGLFVVDFVPVDVGTYVMDVLAGGEKVSESPVLYKVYDASLIRITEANSGVVGQPCQFRLDTGLFFTLFFDKLKVFRLFP